MRIFGIKLGLLCSGANSGWAHNHRADLRALTVQTCAQALRRRGGRGIPAGSDEKDRMGQSP
jgi:hypothetical protein